MQTDCGKRKSVRLTKQRFAFSAAASAWRDPEACAGVCVHWGSLTAQLQDSALTLAGPPTEQGPRPGLAAQVLKPRSASRGTGEVGPGQWVHSPRHLPWLCTPGVLHGGALEGGAGSHFPQACRGFPGPWRLNQIDGTAKSGVLLRPPRDAVLCSWATRGLHVRTRAHTRSRPGCCGCPLDPFHSNPHPSASRPASPQGRSPRRAYTPWF